MGSDKAFLRLGRLTLLEHTIALVKEVCSSVALVGDRERLRPYGIVVEDEFRGQGPLAGIHAALSSPFASDLNLLVAVDLPGLSTTFLKYLLKVAYATGDTVTVPVTNGFTQPLCAVYRKEFGLLAGQALRAGHNKIDPLYAEVTVRRLDEAELHTLGFAPGIFDNVNTPEDWERIQLRLGAAPR